MKQKRAKVFPYIPNSDPTIKEQLLREVGARSTEDFYEDIPAELRMSREMVLPEALTSEYSLSRHVKAILAENTSTEDFLSFLGSGCYQHHVPAVCDEIAMRGEFLSAYVGRPYEDHGRYQALFEYASLMGELLEMDVVSFPVYDGFQACASSLRMAARLTGRKKALIPATINPDKLSKITDYCSHVMQLELINFDPENGQVDLKDLEEKISNEIAAVLIENPSYLGPIETEGDQISAIAHAHGALSIVSVNPMSLGVLSPPASYGADIVCGDIQPFGVHMQFGGGTAGFIATHDEEEFIWEYPCLLWGITSTRIPGEYGFGDVAHGRTSYDAREEAKEYAGTTAGLWGIVAAVYLSLMGPIGMQEIGEGIMSRAVYASRKLNEIVGVTAPVLKAHHFQEFVVNFDDAEKSVSEINNSLRKGRIFGGKDLSQEFPQLGNSALFCVSEVHTKEDIDLLVEKLKEILEK